MTTRTDILQIKLTTDGEGKVKASLAGVGKEVDGLDNSTGSLSKKLTAAKVGIAAIAAGAAFLGTKIISTTAEFEKLNASLKTVTGSQVEATRAMNMIKAMASDTPFSVQQLTESFIKLKALGLDPSEESLMSYGNTASAMGKDLNQMIEAVADASTSEFERLKEFGIKARQQGDQVSFTFQGVTTTVKNNSQAIQQYLLDIGNTTFAGAMNEQMDTLNGAFSNLGDTIDNLLVAMGEAGLAGTTKEAVQDLARVLSDPKLIDAATAVTTAIVDGLSFSGKAVATLVLEFSDLGNALGAYAAIAAEVATFDFDAASAIVDMRKQERAEVEASINALWEKKKVSEQVALSLAQDQLTGKKPMDTGGGNADDTGEGVGNKNADKLIADLDRQIVLYGQVGEAAKLRYDLESGALRDASAAQKAALLDRAEQLDFMAAEREAMQQAIDIQNEWNESRQRERELLQQRFAAVEESLLSEQERLRLHFEEQRLIVEEYFAGDLENEQQKNSLLEQIEAEHLQKLRDLQEKSMSAEQRLWESGWQGKAKVMSGVLGSMSQLMISKNRQMFEIGKKAAIAQGIIDTIASAQSAYKALAGIPVVGPALGAAAAAAALAAGYARVDAIKSTGFDGGGGRSGGAGGGVSVGGGQPPETVPNAGAIAPTGSTRGGSTTTINLVGDENTSFTYGQVQALLGGIRDAIANGDEVIIPAGSRQALELTA